MLIIVNKLNSEKSLIYILGDFNINLLNTDKHVQSSDFLETMYLFSLFPFITKPTRVTKSTATLIDNIYSNHIHNNVYLILILLTTYQFLLLVRILKFLTKIDFILLGILIQITSKHLIGKYSRSIGRK